MATSMVMIKTWRICTKNPEIFTCNNNIAEIQRNGVTHISIKKKIPIESFPGE